MSDASDALQGSPHTRNKLETNQVTRHSRHYPAVTCGNAEPLPGGGNRGGANHIADASKMIDNFTGSRKVELLDSGRCTVDCLTAGRPRKRCTCRCGGRWHGRLDAVGDADLITADPIVGGAA